MGDLSQKSCGAWTSKGRLLGAFAQKFRRARPWLRIRSSDLRRLYRRGREDLGTRWSGRVSIPDEIPSVS